MIRNITPKQFAIRFTLLFVALFSASEALRGAAVDTMLEDGTLKPTALLINRLFPAEDLHVEGRSLLTSGSALHVTRGCEGIEMLLLLIAGLVAFPAPWRHRLRGFCVGLVIVYVLTVMRLALLHFTLRYSPRAWDTLHGIVLPLGPVLLVALYFLHWSAVDRVQAVPRAS